MSRNFTVTSMDGAVEQITVNRGKTNTHKKIHAHILREKKRTSKHECITTSLRLVPVNGPSSIHQANGLVPLLFILLLEDIRAYTLSASLANSLALMQAQYMLPRKMLVQVRFERLTSIPLETRPIFYIYVFEIIPDDETGSLSGILHVRSSQTNLMCN